MAARKHEKKKSAPSTALRAQRKLLPRLLGFDAPLSGALPDAISQESAYTLGSRHSSVPGEVHDCMVF